MSVISVTTSLRSWLINKTKHEIVAWAIEQRDTVERLEREAEALRARVAELEKALLPIRGLRITAAEITVARERLSGPCSRDEAYVMAAADAAAGSLAVMSEMESWPAAPQVTRSADAPVGA